MTAAVGNTWNKPAYDRHAHVSQILAEILDGAPKAANALCNYLFRVCIDGKFEEIELYKLPLGENRRTAKRQGRRYAPNTLRSALKILVELGLVIIDRGFKGGIFRLTINHPGGKRPFERSIKNLTTREKNRPAEQKTDETGGSNDANSFPITEDIQKIAEQTEAAARKTFLAGEKEEMTKAVCVVPEIPEATCQEESEHPAHTDIFVEGIDPDAEGEHPETPVVNTESTEIVLALRDAGLLNPQLKALALKFTLFDVLAALALYQERKQKKDIPNPHGWLTDCLRGKWWTENKQKPTWAMAQYPPELVHWYELADIAGIIDAIDLKYLPCYMGELSVRLLTHDRRPFDPPFILTPWREAMALHPLDSEPTASLTASVTDPTAPAAPSMPSPQAASESEDFQAVEIPDGYQCDPEIQRLIEESLDGPSAHPDQELEASPVPGATAKPALLQELQPDLAHPSRVEPGADSQTTPAAVATPAELSPHQPPAADSAGVESTTRSTKAERKQRQGNRRLQPVEILTSVGEWESGYKVHHGIAVANLVGQERQFKLFDVNGSAYIFFGQIRPPASGRSLNSTSGT